MKLSEQIAELCHEARELQKRTKRTRGADYQARTLIDSIACRADIAHSLQLKAENGKLKRAPNLSHLHD